jgi:putative methylase|tara:strand:- start:756 stop:1412 length:657 start_codon:yes stop_codon:yes gene_type:complete
MAKSESSYSSRTGSKKGLEVLLSRLQGFKEPKVRVEQYATDADIAAEMLWQAYMKEDIGKVSVDLGCGPGMLGIGLLALGAEKVYFVDADQKVIDIAKKNLAKMESEYNMVGEAVFRCQDIDNFNEQIDLVVMNPPFGTKVRHTDKIFLEKAFEIGKVVYSFHKSSTKKFVESFSKDKGFKITDVFDFEFKLKATMEHHLKKVKRINVSCFRMERINL